MSRLKPISAWTSTEKLSRPVLSGPRLVDTDIESGRWAHAVLQLDHEDRAKMLAALNGYRAK
jgi:hypothetical protein